MRTLTRVPMMAALGVALLGGITVLPVSAQNQTQDQTSKQQRWRRLEQAPDKNRQRNWQEDYGDQWQYQQTQQNQQNRYHWHQRWNNNQNNRWNDRRHDAAHHFIYDAQGDLRQALSEIRSGSRSAALRDLNMALRELQNATHDYGGHRAIAMGWIRRAIADLRNYRERYPDRMSVTQEIQRALSEINRAVAWHEQHDRP